jgi:hypothetical protein
MEKGYSKRMELKENGKLKTTAKKYWQHVLLDF